MAETGKDRENGDREAGRSSAITDCDPLFLQKSDSPFLPNGYEITLTDEEEVPPKSTVPFEEAISLICKIEARLRNERYVYLQFLNLLNMYQKKQKDEKDRNEIYEKVAALFKNYPDLLQEFNDYCQS